MLRKILIFFLVMTGFSAWAQSSQSVSELLASDQVNYGQISYIALNAVNQEKEDITEDEAFTILKEAGIIPKKAEVDSFVDFGGLAAFCSNVWEVKGSLMLRILPSKRYAFRQLKLDGVIDESISSGRKCNGHEVLAVMTDCMEFYKLRDLGL